jgi:hypothetical protein
VKKRGQSHVALVLAIGVTISVVLLAATVLYATISDYQQLTPEVSNLVSAVLGGTVGALAVYLGQDRKHEDEESYPWLPGGELPGDNHDSEPEPFSDDEQIDGKPQQIEDDFRP